MPSIIQERKLVEIMDLPFCPYINLIKCSKCDIINIESSCPKDFQKCKNCGNPSSIQAKFCRICGEKFSETEFLYFENESTDYLKQHALLNPLLVKKQFFIPFSDGVSIIPAQKKFLKHFSLGEIITACALPEHHEFRKLIEEAISWYYSEKREEVFLLTPSKLYNFTLNIQKINEFAINKKDLNNLKGHPLWDDILVLGDKEFYIFNPEKGEFVETNNPKSILLPVKRGLLQIFMNADGTSQMKIYEKSQNYQKDNYFTTYDNMKIDPILRNISLNKNIIASSADSDLVFLIADNENLLVFQIEEENEKYSLTQNRSKTIEVFKTLTTSNIVVKTIESIDCISRKYIALRCINEFIIWDINNKNCLNTFKSLESEVNSFEINKNIARLRRNKEERIYLID